MYKLGHCPPHSLPCLVTALLTHCPVWSLPSSLTALFGHCPPHSLPYLVTALLTHCLVWSLSPLLAGSLCGSVGGADLPEQLVHVKACNKLLLTEAKVLDAMQVKLDLLPDGHADLAELRSLAQQLLRQPSMQQLVGPAEEVLAELESMMQHSIDQQQPIAAAEVAALDLTEELLAQQMCSLIKVDDVLITCTRQLGSKALSIWHSNLNKELESAYAETTVDVTDSTQKSGMAQSGVQMQPEKKTVSLCSLDRLLQQHQQLYCNRAMVVWIQQTFLSAMQQMVPTESSVVDLVHAEWPVEDVAPRERPLEDVVVKEDSARLRSDVALDRRPSSECSWCSRTIDCLC